MRKTLAVLCCAIFSAAASGYYLHRHHVIKGKHYHPPTISVNRSIDTLVIINLQAHRHPLLPLAAPSLMQHWTSALQTPAATATRWPGLNTNTRGSAVATGAAPGARSGPPIPATSDTGAAVDSPDIGDGAAYAQLSLDRPCKTVAHCNWLGVRAIRDGVPQKAIRPFQTALELATQQHDQSMTLIGYHNLAMAYWWMKHYRQAATWAEKGLFNPPPTAIASDQEAPIAQD
jgi:hypothetical protein